jgi:hypothetical protein
LQESLIREIICECFDRDLLETNLAKLFERLQRTSETAGSLLILRRIFSSKNTSRYRPRIPEIADIFRRGGVAYCGH